MPLENINSKLLVKHSNELAFKIATFDSLEDFDHLLRFNYYSILLIQEGNLYLEIDLGKYQLSSNTAICLSPYQPFKLTSEEKVEVYMLNFHPDFFCTYKHQNEIETEGILFNNFSSVPFFSIKNLSKLIDRIIGMNTEMTENNIGIHEVLISSLKIFLINLIREKQSILKTEKELKVKEKPVLLQNFVNSVEKNFRNLHSAKDYARILFVSPQQLSKVVKSSCDITLSKMITNRIMIEAKRELYLTSKAVKEVANELGYKDEFYFSRVFKKEVGVSPKQYRQTVGFGKME